MLDALPKAAFSVLASSHTLKRLASRYGMRRPGSFARRFIAGETRRRKRSQAARVIEQQGLTVTLDLLGESVATTDEAGRATRAYVDMIGEIEQAGVGRNISLKLTQLGLDIDRATCVDNLRRILDAATPGGFFVRIDMENSPYTDAHARDVRDGVEHRLPQRRRRHPVVSEAIDRRRGTAERAGRARPPREGRVPRAARGRVPAEVRGRCGVRRSDAAAAAARHLPGDRHARPGDDRRPRKQFADQQQHRRRTRSSSRCCTASAAICRRRCPARAIGFRVYVPFGKEWFPYFMRRLGERPANVGFVVRSLFREK